MKKIIAIFAFCLLPFAVQALDLTGAAMVSITSDAASAAKTMAMAEARRQIITEVLSKYAHGGALNELIESTKDSDLANLISSTGIDGERLSSTTYQANIKMTVDANAARRWLDENNIQNWLVEDESLSADKSTVLIELSGGLRDWIKINVALRDKKLNLDVKKISGATLIASIPASSRRSFIAAIAGDGWKYSDSDGLLRIWQ
ncbi:MAG: hypothetical protein LBD50_03065 [Rickettsiales bacterium]|jgi:hypothetical protein|nr:hypothetical protein [Rickettsiales bacterium]